MSDGTHAAEVTRQNSNKQCHYCLLWFVGRARQRVALRFKYGGQGRSKRRFTPCPITVSSPVSRDLSFLTADDYSLVPPEPCPRAHHLDYYHLATATAEIAPNHLFPLRLPPVQQSRPLPPVNSYCVVHVSEGR